MRNIDKRYAARKCEFKHYFAAVMNASHDYVSQLPAHFCALDIGCAAGDFLYYFGGRYPEAELMGADVIPELVAVAAARVPGVKFIRCDISDRQTLPTRQFDLVTMIGVHSIFESIDAWLDNLLATVRSGGRAYVFGLFNPYGIDTKTMVKYSDNRIPEWISGWTQVSRMSMGFALAERRLEFRFHDYEVTEDIAQTKGDPLHSWTLLTADPSARLVVNGANVIHSFATLEISKE